MIRSGLPLFFIISFIFTVGSGVKIMERSKAKANVPPADEMHCSEGWRITGYFTPVETDYSSGETTEVEINGVGKMSFDAEFVRTVFDEQKGFGEGWGKTRFGWYLGNFDGGWHKSGEPLDAHNSPLKTNSIAVDNSLIPNDSIVEIPGLPGEYGHEKFVANDVGVTVHGKHIDIYTGEGKDAEREMYRVTFEDDNDLQKVCFKPADK
jgi:3D (Asp-Asp-Asp) domain-containing protein